MHVAQQMEFFISGTQQELVAVLEFIEEMQLNTSVWLSPPRARATHRVLRVRFGRQQRDQAAMFKLRWNT